MDFSCNRFALVKNDITHEQCTAYFMHASALPRFYVHVHTKYRLALVELIVLLFIKRFIRFKLVFESNIRFFLVTKCATSECV